MAVGHREQDRAGRLHGNAVPNHGAGIQCGAVRSGQRSCATPVGTATFTFSDGNNATFAYTVNGIAQTKSITRKCSSRRGPCAIDPAWLPDCVALLCLFQYAHGLMGDIDAAFLDGMTGDDAAGRRALQQRHLAAATVIGVRAARMEGAARRRRERVRHFTGDRRARACRSSRDRESRRAASACRDAAASRTTSPRRRSSTMRPRYMTPTRSAM